MTIPKAKAEDHGKRVPDRACSARSQRRRQPEGLATRKPFAPFRRRRADEEALTVTGPLAHQRGSQPQTGPAASSQRPEPPAVDAVADRILSGFTAKGEATARVELRLDAGEFAGAQVDFVAGARGLEVNVLAATASARRIIQARLTDLADALAQRGVYARKLAVTVRQRDNRGGSRQDGRQ